MTKNPEARALAATLIAQFEGFSETAYPDPPTQDILYSIGYGHQIKPDEELSRNSRITRELALKLLGQDLTEFADIVDALVHPELSTNQAAAVYSFCYNVGPTRFRRSTLLILLNAEDYPSVSLEFAKWNKVAGISNA